jgi:hypothetical protein
MNVRHIVPRSPLVGKDAQLHRSLKGLTPGMRVGAGEPTLSTVGPDQFIANQTGKLEPNALPHDALASAPWSMRPLSNVEESLS